MKTHFRKHHNGSTPPSEKALHKREIKKLKTEIHKHHLELKRIRTEEARIRADKRRIRTENRLRAKARGQRR